MSVIGSRQFVDLACVTLLLSKRLQNANLEVTMKRPTRFPFSGKTRLRQQRGGQPNDRWTARLIGFGLGLSLLAVAGQSACAQTAVTSTAPARKELLFQESKDVLSNPERGFYWPVTTGRIRALGNLRPQGITLLFVESDLREFKERDLSPEKLTEIKEALTVARREGLKVIFRAAYGFTGRDYRADPKDLNRILGHIRQISAILSEQADVVCGVQAGMLGPWGEWHGSNWGDPPSLEARRSVLFGWLDALPTAIMVDIRRPMFIRDIYATEPGGSTLTAETAYSGSRLSRTGFHDDSFLSLPSDSGTFVEEGWDRQRELEWCNQHGRFTPSGGETVPTSAPTPIMQVVREMALFHTSYLNIAYHKGTLEGWKKTEYQGENGFQHVARRLGYRFVAQRLRYASEVKAGEGVRFELTLSNVGFASPHLPREVSFSLIQSDRQVAGRTVLTTSDPRRWDPEAGTITLQGEIPVSTGPQSGKCQLVMQLSDPAPSLRDDGRYAIRLANQNIAFIEATGWNVLADDIEIR